MGFTPTWSREIPQNRLGHSLPVISRPWPQSPNSSSPLLETLMPVEPQASPNTSRPTELPVSVEIDVKATFRVEAVANSKLLNTAPPDTRNTRTCYAKKANMTPFRSPKKLTKDATQLSDHYLGEQVGWSASCVGPQDRPSLSRWLTPKWIQSLGRVVNGQILLQCDPSMVVRARIRSMYQDFPSAFFPSRYSCTAVFLSFSYNVQAPVLFMSRYIHSCVTVLLSF